jgi:hypothetical protein
LPLISVLLATPALAQYPAPYFETESHVETLAALRALPPKSLKDRQLVTVDWRSSPLDGGGGRFVWLARRSDPDDDGLVISPLDKQPLGRWYRILVTPGVVSPLYFGARCDGSTDDAFAINKALAVLRRPASRGDAGIFTGVLQLPARQCVIKTTIDATGLASVSVMIEGTGGSLLCEAPGVPCVDAMDSARLAFRDVTIYGDPRNLPQIGLQLGRPFPHGTAAGMYLDHVSISGNFSFAAFYNLNAETQLDIKLNASNGAPGGYGAVYDGINHFHAHSAFVTITSPVDTMESFNDNTCLNCRITSSGTGGTPLWMGGTAELTFENCYISNFNKGFGAVLYGLNTNPNFDAHFEADLTSVFLLAGSRHPTIYGLKYREHDYFGGISMFALDSKTDSATLQNVEIDVGRFHHHDRGSWFDNPVKYTMSGRVTGITDQGWVIPGGGFSGEACFANRCVTSEAAQK